VIEVTILNVPSRTRFNAPAMSMASAKEASMLRSLPMKNVVKMACALALAAALSGCVVYPAYGPRYGYRPHPFYYY